MREIKFRAWLSDTSPLFNNPIMIYSEEQRYEHKCSMIDFWQQYINHTGDIKKLMQFTGLKDDNGNDVYEFDIVNFNKYKDHECEKTIICYDKFQAKYKAVPLLTYKSNAGFGGWTGYELCFGYEFKVIGNIYENLKFYEEGY